MLPVIETPKFDVALPSTGQVIKVRPMVVAEQKVILQATEMQAKDQLQNAIDDVLKACTFGAVDIDSLAIYDVEYLLLQIRSRSVSDVAELRYTCRATVDNKLLNVEELKYNPDAEKKYGAGTCDTKIPVKISLGSIKAPVGERPDNRIMLSDSIGVIMSDITYGMYKKIADKSGVELVAACIDSVINGDEVVRRGQFTDEEMVIWVQNLLSESFQAMSEYVASAPKLRQTIKLRCPSCGTEEIIELEGLDDFLA